MMFFLSKFLPKRLTGQLMLLVLIALIAAQLVNLFILVDANELRARENIVISAIDLLVERVDENDGNYPPPRKGRGKPEFLYSRTSQAGNLQPQKDLSLYRQIVAAELANNAIDYRSFELVVGHSTDLKVGRKPPRGGLRPPEGFGPSPKGRDSIDRRPPPGSKNSVVPEPTSEVLILSVELEQDRWANVILTHKSIEALTPRIMLATAALLLISLLSVGFFMRRLVTPLSELTEAAQKFGRGAKPMELSETGPEDIRKAAEAFNQMQRRLGRTLETQRTMLRAVGHDLRTPLTSLRIRSEMIPEELLRDKFINTIDEMSALTDEILGWAKNLSGLEEASSVDLTALINSVVDDYADQGETLSAENLLKATVNIRRMAFKRALQNVVSNAIKYADSAQISMSQTSTHYKIHVDDDGPGIPEEQLSRAIEPFVRLESSRNRDTGGTGLGLSITETILHTEGGTLSLSNCETKGLRVTLSIPK